jgi:uncharacterized iron-regulated protein
MKGKVLLLAGVAAIGFSSCKKEKLEPQVLDYTGKQTAMLSTFSEKIAEQSYNDLNNAATELQAAIDAFGNTGSDNAFQEARLKWTAFRQIWEQTEAYMYFGPAKDGKYAAILDTWPTSGRALDSLMERTSYSTELKEVQKLPAEFRGLHPLEWILFGPNGEKTKDQVTGRQAEYMRALARDIKLNSEALFQEWASVSLNYTAKVRTAGDGSKEFSTKLSFFQILVQSMSSMCGNISSNKLENPLIKFDSTVVESPYSKSSLTDIKNNLSGLRNVYTGKYNAYQGIGLSDLVSEKDKTLDTRVKDRIDSALSAANRVTMKLDRALFFQRADLFTLKERVDSVKSVIGTDLKNFVTDNLK